MTNSAKAGTLPLISIVAPVYNESATLAEFVRRNAAVCDTLFDRYSSEIVLVDDGSTDDTLQVARSLIANEPRLRVIELRRNFGQTAALQAGLTAAAGDFVISMDSDLQHFPEDIPLFIDQAERGFDLVCGWRKDRQENVLRRWPSRAANLLIKRVIGIELHDFGTTFRLYRADLLTHMKLIGEEHRFVPALAHMIGARITEIPIKNIERPVGVSNYGIGRTFGVAMDILFLYFSRFYATRPLRVFGKLAAGLLIPGVLIAVALLTINLMTGEPTTRTRSGWFLLSALLMLSSLQVLLTGILAEVLARIFYRTGSGESFVVRREWNAAEPAPPR
ncbi:MAG: glycosyltransferase family 2 protein [Acidobacteriota bacterium]